jgi:hypothetical protein
MLYVRVVLLLFSESIGVVINSSSREAVWHAHGLRQGDSLSLLCPCQFIETQSFCVFSEKKEVMDILNAIVWKAESMGIFQNFTPATPISFCG